MYQYLSGFGNHFMSEREPNTLPPHQNSPQCVAQGLYAEQISGTAFTAPRATNKRTWFYRIRPSVIQEEFHPFSQAFLQSATYSFSPASPTPLRWDPLPIPEEPCDFVNGLITFAVNGNCHLLQGAAIHLYAINNSMTDRFFYNADGDFLIVPQLGGLLLRTELGLIDCNPGEITVIPRGIKFQVHLTEKSARGYVLENYGSHFTLPELGPIGANGLANPRDFLTPTAFYEDVKRKFNLICKFQGTLWRADINHSPLDVVGWHGNYVPYKYNLSHFNAINSVSFDHADPSIFTVLTSPSAIPGTANVDFVIFPPRWSVADHSFRPPYFHRNIMSEYMGIIRGRYEAKEQGFIPGGGSLHNSMTAHGPDKDAYEKAIHAKLKPEYLNGFLAFMFESCFPWLPTSYALNTPLKQKDYLACWQSLTAHFKANH